ncbi:hypothetical protein [Terriglobus sp. RCC_193]|uniref:hypothetical protein n=1 Tax=Terriglobus sp. RCC_193 TaxID=3239218 RepID=UPI003523652C
MSTEILDCPEVVGKTVKSLKLFMTGSVSSEIQLEFADGTTFSASCESRQAVKAALIQTGVGEPEVLKTYAE